MPRTPRTGRPSDSRRISPIRAILSTIAVIAGGVVLAAAAAGGTYAFWNDAAPVNGGTVDAGSSGLTVNGVQSVTVNLTGTTLLPGRSVVQAAPLQFANVGDTPLNVTSAVVFAPASAALQPYVHVSLRPAVGATCTVTADPTTLPAAIAPVGFVVGQTIPMCLEVLLRSNAPATMQDTTVSFTINLTAAQVRP